MPSVVDLCNEALDLVGASPITDLDDGSPEASLCFRHYPLVRDELLRSYPWNCAQMRTALPALADAPSWGYGKAYVLPTAPDFCLRVLRLEDCNADYRIEQLRTTGGELHRVLVTDLSPPVKILFIRRITNPEHFDPMLAKVLVAELAVALTPKITESGSRMQFLMQLAEKRKQDAMRVDAREGRMAPLEVDSWIAGRWA